MQGLKDKERKEKDREKGIKGVLANLVCKTFCSLLQRLPNLQGLKDKEKKRQRQRQTPSEEFLRIWSVYKTLNCSLLQRLSKFCKDSKTKKEKKKTETNAFRGVFANLVCKTLNCSWLQRLSKSARKKRWRKKRKRQRQTPSGEFFANLNCSLLQRLSKFARTQRQRKKRKEKIQRQKPSREFLQIRSVRP